MANLKPCPFCGCEAELYIVSERLQPNNRPYFYARVGCIKCGVFFVTKYHHPNDDRGFDKEKQEIITAWNRRDEQMIKREDIPKLTPEQALDEEVFMEFEKALKSARRKAVAAQKAERLIFGLIDDMCIDADHTASEAENADTLADAITCYIQYGEFSLSKIMREVRSVYGKEG